MSIHVSKFRTVRGPGICVGRRVSGLPRYPVLSRTCDAGAGSAGRPDLPGGGRRGLNRGDRPDVRPSGGDPVPANRAKPEEPKKRPSRAKSAKPATRKDAAVRFLDEIGGRHRGGLREGRIASPRGRGARGRHERRSRQLSRAMARRARELDLATRRKRAHRPPDPIDRRVRTSWRCSSWQENGGRTLRTALLGRALPRGALLRRALLGGALLGGTLLGRALLGGALLRRRLLPGRLLRGGLAFRFLATAVPPVTAAPTAAALAAARSGFSATADTTFFAPAPTADAASPAFSVTVSIVDWSSD